MKTRDQEAATQNLSTLAMLAERDATDAMLLNRLMTRGSDPLSIITGMPPILHLLNSNIEYGDDGDISTDHIKAAIELAHKAGPGSLLKGAQGLNPDRLGESNAYTWSFDQRLEAAWIMLADASSCMEEGYSESVSFVARLSSFVESCHQVAQRLTDVRREASFEAAVSIALDKILDGFTQEVINPERGHVKSNTTQKGKEDRGFYVAYKAGYHVVCVEQGGLTFWGTDGSTTLEAEGIVVDKVISPYFGIIFPKKAAA